MKKKKKHNEKNPSEYKIELNNATKFRRLSKSSFRFIYDTRVQLTPTGMWGIWPELQLTTLE